MKLRVHLSEEGKCCMTDRKRDFYVGFFVIVTVICTGYLFLVVGEFSRFFKDRYTIHGYFSSVSGLKTGASVDLAGVRVGNVSDIAIDPDHLVAKVTMEIDSQIEISEDSIASVRTAGIIGEKFIEILPGGSDFMLAEDAEIENTESALDIESLIKKFIFNNDSP
jgi:phospholipid/cholesterol/gamma-HCH transport system substrate-binding protein